MTEQGRFTLNDRDGIPVVDVSGDVDITNIEDFQNVMLSASANEAAGVVTSLRHVAYLDSRMVHEIFTLAKRFAQNRKSFAMVWPQSRSARYILETAGVATIVKLFDDVDSAVASIKGS